MRNQLRWLPVSIIVVLLDQLTKTAANNYLQFHQKVVINRFFNLTLDYNNGAAFSFLSASNGWQRWLFTGIAIAVSIFIVWYLKKMPLSQNETAIGLTLVLGGALGNVIDRVSQGVVTDFIQWHIGEYYWPVFNIADTAVCIGAVLFMLSMRKH